MVGLAKLGLGDATLDPNMFLAGTVLSNRELMFGPDPIDSLYSAYKFHDLNDPTTIKYTSMVSDEQLQKLHNATVGLNPPANRTWLEQLTDSLGLTNGSTTYNLGGEDAQGNPIYNPVYPDNADDSLKSGIGAGLIGIVIAGVVGFIALEKI